MMSLIHFLHYSAGLALLCLLLYIICDHHTDNFSLSSRTWDLWFGGQIVSFSGVITFSVTTLIAAIALIVGQV